MYRKIIALLIVLSLFSFPSTARETQLFQSISQMDTVVIDAKGIEWSLSVDNVLSYKDEYTHQMITIDTEDTIEWLLYRQPEFDYTKVSQPIITDIVASKSDEGVWISGIFMYDRMDEDLYKNTAKLVGTPYVFLSRFTSIGYRIPYLFELYDHYGYPYNTDVFKDTPEEDTENIRYYWEDFEVMPKITNSTQHDDQIWLISEYKWGDGPGGNYQPNLIDPDYLVVTNINETDEKARPMSFIKASAFNDSAKQSYMPYQYQMHYEFTTDGVFILQDEVTDYIQVISMYDDNLGIAYELDLSYYGKPKYVQTLYK